MYPLRSFVSAQGGSRLLNSTSGRARAIQSILSLERESNFPGIHLDFEYLPPEDSKKLAGFLSEIKKSAFKGKLTMAIFPPVEFPEKWSRFHDIRLLGIHLDEVVLMCYDLHGRHTGPGPVTDADWGEKNIKAILRHMKARNVWLGIPAYGYQWCNATAIAVSSKQALALSRVHGAERDLSLNVRIVYKKAGRNCEMYASDAHTRAALIQLSAKYELAGTALWRLGFEE
jgi:spore germination protein YaaH